MICERSARKYCAEDLSLIENYDRATADKSEMWEIHHRREIDEELSGRELIRRKEYFHRPASELIFLTRKDHRRLHGLNLSEETKKKMSLAKIGKKHSAETRKKMSAAKRGKKGYLFGTRWWNNGVKTVRARDCPPGFAPGRCLRRS